MSEENTEKSTWDELVGELGVNVTDDALERRQPAPKELPRSRREKADRKDETSAAPSDWEGLASSLGIEVPPVVEQPPVQKPVVSKAEKPAPTPPRPERKPRIEETIVEVQVEVEVESDRVDSSEFVEQLDDGEEAEDELPRISGEAARSAFDALFAADAASWGSAFVSPRTNVESSFLFTEGEEAVFTEDIPDDAGGEGDEEDEPKRGRRRRRRGGRGRGRGSAKTVAEESENQDSGDSEKSVRNESGETDAGEAESEEAPEKRPRRRRSRGRSRSKDNQDISSEEDESRIKKHVASHVGDEEDDDDDDLSYDDEDGPTAGGSRSSHRNLPTWDEAIGVIVDGNLAQRSKSPAKSSTGSSSRGRSRGGRRHKKS